MKIKTGNKIEVEETIIVCDFCKRDTTERILDDNKSIEHSGQIWMNFGYYSHRDGDKLSWDMCCDCASEIENMLRDKWPTLPPSENILDIE